MSPWPWRALAYLVTGAPIAAGTAFAVLVAALPWLVGAQRVVEGEPLTTPLLVLAVGSLVLTLVLGLPLAMVLAGLERWRLGIVDPRPVASVRRTAPVGASAWLRRRVSAAATWREALFAVLLGTVVPLGYGVGALGAATTAILLSSLWLVVGGSGPIAMGVTEISSAGQALPYAAAGLVLLLLSPYVVGLLAAGQATLTRALLDDVARHDRELREISRSRTRLVQAHEAERRRIERDLHDGAQHQLTSLTLQLAMARLDVPEDSDAGKALASAHEQAKESMAGLRELIHGIRPQTLADLGLVGALRELAGRSAITVDVTVSPQGIGAVSEEVESTAYFVAAEGLANVTKHSAASRAEVLLERNGDVLAMQISDDGRGGADPDHGTGLTGLADRVAAVQGRLLLASPVGGPTQLRVELPCLP